MRIVVTGVAGFIGSHVARALLKRGNTVIGIDDFNNYYDVSLKEHRVKEFEHEKNFKLYRADIRDLKQMHRIFESNKVEKVVHLAARAGVRASIEQPLLYEDVNVRGTLNLLELAKKFEIRNFVFASSSSVYGANKKVPFSEEDNVDKAISPYAATKKAGEVICYTYHHLYGLPVSCLRFFTVYGPAGRPDMAMFKFTKWISEGKPLIRYGDGSSKRDYTYIDDIIAGVLAALDKNFEYEIFNLGNSSPVELNYLISLIESELGRKAVIKQQPMPPGDVPITFADIAKAKKLLGFNPKTKIEQGVKRFIKWYMEWRDSKE